MTAERLHNAQINEGLGAGPNRLTLGKSYSSCDGLGAITWGSVGNFFQRAAVLTFAPIAFPTIAAISTVNPKLGSQISGGILSTSQARQAGYAGEALAAGYAGYSIGGSSLLKGLTALTPAINAFFGRPAGLPTQAGAAPPPALVPRQVGQAPNAGASYTDNVAPGASSFGQTSPSGGYSAYAPSPVDASQAGILGSMPSWVLPVVGGLLLVKFALGSGGSSARKR